SFTASRVILPGTSALTLTWVRGSIFPGARTREVMSSTRTRASCTPSARLRPERITLATTSPATTTTASTIHIHFFFIAAPLLCPSTSFVASSHPVDLRLRHANRRQRRDAVALRPLELHLRVDQIEDRRGTDIVFLLGEIEVLGRGDDRRLSDVVALERH